MFEATLETPAAGNLRTLVNEALRIRFPNVAAIQCTFHQANLVAFATNTGRPLAAFYALVARVSLEALVARGAEFGACVVTISRRARPVDVSWDLVTA